MLYIATKIEISEVHDSNARGVQEVDAELEKIDTPSASSALAAGAEHTKVSYVAKAKIRLPIETPGMAGWEGSQPRFTTLLMTADT